MTSDISQYLRVFCILLYATPPEQERERLRQEFVDKLIQDVLREYGKLFVSLQEVSSDSIHRL